MLDLYGDEALRKEMGKRGRQRVEELYDWEICVEKMIQVYHDVRKKNIG